MKKQLARLVNQGRRVAMAVKVFPALAIGMAIEDHADKLPMGDDVREGVLRSIRATRHGYETAFMLMTKHQDSFIAPIRAQMDYIKAMKKCHDEGTMGRYMDDPAFVREVVLSV